MKRNLLNALKGLVNPAKHGSYLTGDILERLVALRYTCMRSRIPHRKPALETLALGIQRMKELQKTNKILKKKFAAIEAFSYNKIAQHQGVNQLSASQGIFSMRAIPWDHLVVVPTIGLKRRDYLLNRSR